MHRYRSLKVLELNWNYILFEWFYCYKSIAECYCYKNWPLCAAKARMKWCYCMGWEKKCECMDHRNSPV